MAAQHDGKSAHGKRRMRFAHAASAIETVLRKAAAQRGFAERRLLTNWPDIAGAELARLCRPVRLNWGRREEPGGASLVVEAVGAAAPQLEHRAPVLIERVNAALGWRAVSRLRVTQTGAIAQPPAPAPPPERPPLARKIDAPISEIEDADLRDKLARLGANIAARRR